MTFDPHGDTIPTKFEELRDKRLPVAIRKIELLGNLGRTTYGATDPDKIRIVNALQDALNGLTKAYRLEVSVKPAAPPPPPKPTRVPAGTAEGGASFESEVRWALDAIRRGDYDLAENRLKRCLTA